MKNQIKFFTIVSVATLGLCLFLASCKKILPESIPRVTIGTASYVGLDTISLPGTIVSDGNSDITSEGFVYSDNPAFSGTPIQVSVYSSQNSFSSRIHAIHYNTYYFKAYASNEKGTGYSSVIKYTVPAPPPATAPCSLTTNVLTNNGATYSVSVMGNGSSPSWGSYEVDFYGSTQDVYIYFPSIPHNGIYKTVGDPSYIVEGQVSINIPGGWTGPSTVDDGQGVYVALDTVAHTTNITFCSLSYNLGGLGTTYLSGKGSY